MSDKASTTVLVTGASGLLGRAVVRIFKEKNFAVIGVGFSRVGPGLVKCDLTDQEAVTELIEREKPDFIINSAAQRSLDAVENNYLESCRLNIKAAEHIAQVSHRLGIRLIHISTDYVFDGLKAPYKADAVCKPLSKYGEVKLEAEKCVLATDPNACVLRVPLLYGPVERLDESVVTSLLSLLRSGQEHAISHHEQRYPAHVNDIANILADMVALIKEGKNLSGIYQWSGQEKMTKFDMMVTIANVFGLSCQHMSPAHIPSPTRPFDPQMDVSRLTELGIYHHTKFEDGIKECLEKWI